MVNAYRSPEYSHHIRNRGRRFNGGVTVGIFTRGSEIAVSANAQCRVGQNTGKRSAIRLAELLNVQTGALTAS